MATFEEHLQKHSKRVVYHVKKHHKKYLFGIVGGAIAVKFALTFMAGIGLYEGYGTFAQEFTGEVLSGSTNTGDINIGNIQTGEVLSGSTNTGDINIGNIQTGEALSGTTNIGDINTGNIQTGEVLSGTTNTGNVQTGEVLSGIVNTGNIQTGLNSTGTNQTGSENTGGFTQEPQNQAVICNNSNFNFINPLSGSKLKGNINFSWTYSGTSCSGKNFDVYMLDHNNQWLKIGTSSYLNTWFQFNSYQLYSGFYNILSSSGNTIYTGQYTGLNSKFYTGYKTKFVDQTGNIVYTGNIFTIDNQLPEITGILIDFTGNYNSGYIGLSGIINLNFTSTEDLTGIIVNILGTNATFVSKSGFNYKYSQILSNQNSGTNVFYNISFSDLANNTGLQYLTSQVIFDKSSPSLNHILFTGYYTGFDVLRNGSELNKYDFTYTLSGSQTGVKFTSSNYVYTGLVNITGLNQTKVYNFVLKLTDTVNNILAIGGIFSFNTGGRVLFTYQTITISSNSGNNIVVNVSTGSTGAISNISEIIKKEVDKFNECKAAIKTTTINIKVNNQDIKINMPSFEQSYIRKIVNSFTIVIMDKLQKSTLTEENLSNIIDRFDDFLIILKLIRDDGNQCKQNLSNYHIRLFQKILKEYNISLE